MSEQEMRKKVINGLMVCFTRISCKGKGCPYEPEYERSRICQAHLRDDALALLKAQEPVEPTIGRAVEHDGHDSWWYQCGKCEKPIDWQDNYCRHCGKPVKWE